MEQEPFHLEANHLQALTTFESDSYTVSATREAVLDFLSNLEHLEGLLPDDRIEKTKFTPTTASFKIQGLADISIALNKSEAERVVYANASDKPFPFELEVKLSEENGLVSGKACLHADVSTLMGMMMKTPLTNFLNALGKNLQRHFQ